MRDSLQQLVWTADGITVPANATVDLSECWSEIAGRFLQKSQAAMRLTIGEGSRVRLHMDWRDLPTQASQQTTFHWQLQSHAILELIETPSDSIAHHVAHHQFEQGAESSVQVYAGFWGGEQNRRVFESTLQQPGARFSLNALQCGKEKQRHDLMVRCSHQAPDTHSVVRSHALLNDCAQASFDAKAIIASHCPGSSAHQHNKNILLSARAKMHAKPALQIDTDDVVCSHGSTTGALSEEALFALRSRGIAENDAKRLLMLAFVKSMVDAVPDESIQKQWLQSMDLQHGMEVV